jgi:hypothetical protein
VVEEVEGFEAELHREALVNGEDARDLGVEGVDPRTAEGVSADVAVGAVPGALQHVDGGGAGKIGASCERRSECCRVEIGAVGRASGGTDRAVEVDGLAGNEVGAIVADIGERGVGAGGDGERHAAGDVGRAGELPKAESVPIRK